MTDNPKDVMGSKKDLISLVPPEGIRGIAKVMKYGAYDARRADGGSGYGAYNWRHTKVRLSIYLDAIARHNMKLIEGEDLDEDSGLPHTYHIGANICIIEDAKKYNCLIDDRPAVIQEQQMAVNEKEMDELTKDFLKSYERGVCVKKATESFGSWGIDEEATGCVKIEDHLEKMRKDPTQHFKGDE